jgi:hypothetical protein
VVQLLREGTGARIKARGSCLQDAQLRGLAPHAHAL